MPITYEFTVRWGDTDAAGIVFYPNFCKWIDEATHEFMRYLGKPSSQWITEKQISVPLLETHVHFKKPLRFEDKVTIHSQVCEIGNKTFKMTHAFVRDEEVIAEGTEVRAWTSFKDKPKALIIPEYVKEKMLYTQGGLQHATNNR